MRRRSFIKGLTGSSFAIGTGASLFTERRAAAAPPPDPSSSGIDHIVVVTMENRSFDHLLGWLPGANGMQANLNYVDKAGLLTPPTPWLLTTLAAVIPIPTIHTIKQGRV